MYNQYWAKTLRLPGVHRGINIIGNLVFVLES